MADRDDETRPKEEKSEERDLPRPPDEAVTTEENILGGQGGDDESEVGEDQTRKASESDPEDSDKQRKRRSRRDRKINRLTRDRAAAEEERDAYRRRVQELEAQLQEQGQSQSPPQKPKLHDFDTEEEFADALLEWKLKTEDTKAKKKAPSQPPPRAQRITNEEITGFVEEGMKTGDDFKRAYELAGQGKFVTDEDMTEYILDSDYGTEIFVALSKDPELAREIAFQRTPMRKLEALQDLEIRVQPDTRPEDRQAKKERQDQGRERTPVSDQGGNQQQRDRARTKAPPPGPRQERGGPSTPSQGIRDLIPPNNEDLRSGDMEAYMRQRRRDHADGIDQF